MSSARKTTATAAPSRTYTERFLVRSIQTTVQAQLTAVAQRPLQPPR